MEKKEAGESYVQKAENVIQAMLENGGKMTSETQIRKILALSNRIMSRLAAGNAAPGERLSAEQMAQLYSLQVQIIYQAARSAEVKNFQERAGLMERLRAVRTFEGFAAFHHYLEALVAYYKYYECSANAARR